MPENLGCLQTALPGSGVCQASSAACIINTERISAPTEQCVPEALLGALRLTGGWFSGEGIAFFSSCPPPHALPPFFV